MRQNSRTISDADQVPPRTRKGTVSASLVQRTSTTLVTLGIDARYHSAPANSQSEQGASWRAMRKAIVTRVAQRLIDRTSHDVRASLNVQWPRFRRSDKRYDNKQTDD
jgi:hypothetical protein